MANPIRPHIDELNDFIGGEAVVQMKNVGDGLIDRSANVAAECMKQSATFSIHSSANASRGSAGLLSADRKEIVQADITRAENAAIPFAHNAIDASKSPAAAASKRVVHVSIDTTAEASIGLINRIAGIFGI